MALKYWARLASLGSKLPINSLTESKSIYTTCTEKQAQRAYTIQHKGTGSARKTQPQRNRNSTTNIPCKI